MISSKLRSKLLRGLKTINFKQINKYKKYERVTWSSSDAMKNQWGYRKMVYGDTHAREAIY